MKEVVGVQYLRGLAALMVVVFHLAPPLAQAWGIGRFPVAMLAGGVDVFFVISGFIMVHTTRNVAGGVRDAVRFFARRVARIPSSARAAPRTTASWATRRSRRTRASRRSRLRRTTRCRS